MPDPNQVAAGAAAAESIVEGLVPELAPFHPLIALVTTAVMAHFLATGKWPTEAQVRASIPVDYQSLVTTWGDWKPSGDGSLKP